MRGDAIIFGLGAFAPAGFVHSLTYLPARPRATAVVAGVSLMLGLLTHVYLKSAISRDREVLLTTQVRPLSTESFGLFLTLALPLLAPVNLSTVPYAASGFCLLCLALIVRSRFFAGNPMLTLLGYSAFEAECSSGVTYHILRRGTFATTTQNMQVVRIGDICFVEVGHGC